MPRQLEQNPDQLLTLPSPLGGQATGAEVEEEAATAVGCSTSRALPSNGETAAALSGQGPGEEGFASARRA